MSNYLSSWLTEHPDELYALTFESMGVTDYGRLVVLETTFPKDEPKRHTVCLSLFSREDLLDLVDMIEEKLGTTPETSMCNIDLSHALDMEWSGERDANGEPTCPNCKSPKLNGHRANCQLDEYISNLKRAMGVH